MEKLICIRPPSTVLAANQIPPVDHQSRHSDDPVSPSLFPNDIPMLNPTTILAGENKDAAMPSLAMNLRHRYLQLKQKKRTPSTSSYHYYILPGKTHVPLSQLNVYKPHWLLSLLYQNDRTHLTTKVHQLLAECLILLAIGTTSTHTFGTVFPQELDMYDYTATFSYFDAQKLFSALQKPAIKHQPFPVHQLHVQPQLLTLDILS